MKINTAFILCAGYGKRLNPITLKIPKPLIKINEITLLENSINFLEKLEIEKIKINTYFLHNQIQDFILNYKSNLKIEIINDGNEILDTGGGILNLINKSDENDFLILNPDTLWGDNYLKTTMKMMDFYFEKEIKNLLIFKKALFNSNFIEESEFLEDIKPLLNNETFWKPHVLLLAGDFFASKKEHIKAKEFYNQIFLVKNLQKDFYDQVRSRLVLITDD